MTYSGQRGAKPLTANGRSSANATKKPVSSHEVAELIEFLSDRWQRVPCSAIRPNEINFLPRWGHSHVPKIRQLIKIRGWETLCMLKYASVRFRGKQMPVADKPDPVTARVQSSGDSRISLTEKASSCA
jgi:hypothetical protein